MQTLAMIPCFESAEIAAQRCFRNSLMIQVWMSSSPQSWLPTPSTDAPCHTSGLPSQTVAFDKTLPDKLPRSQPYRGLRQGNKELNSMLIGW